MQKVLVAGSGPAGLVAAIKLARSGRRVIVLAPFLQNHKIGECVPGAINRLLAELELPLIDSSDGVHRKIGGAISLWAGSLRREDFMTRAEGCGWRLNRKSFERSIENVATALGVERRIGRIRFLLQSDERRWRIQTDNGESIDVDWIVDATGRSASIARKQMVPSRTGPPLIGLWAKGKIAAENPTSRTLIESDLEGWWYAAFLPDNRPLVIFHTSPEFAYALIQNPQSWKSKLDNSQLIREYVLPNVFDGQPLRVSDARSARLGHCFGHGWVACGDAAMAFDPIASQGIFNALATGSMAADALIKKGHQDLLAHYGNSLEEIGNINEKRRLAYYHSAWLHFRSPFWVNHLQGTSAVGIASTVASGLRTEFVDKCGITSREFRNV